MTQPSPLSSIFSETITIWPYRSLSPRGFAIFMAVLCALAFSIGLGFFLLGAWPVIGFLGLEILVVWAVFKMNYRAAQKRQSVTVTDKEVTVRTTHPNGKTEENAFPTSWATVSISPSSAPDLAARYHQKITIRSHGVILPIGEFLHPAETPVLARDITDMVERARQAGIDHAHPQSD